MLGSSRVFRDSPPFPSLREIAKEAEEAEEKGSHLPREKGTTLVCIIYMKLEVCCFCC